MIALIANQTYDNLLLLSVVITVIGASYSLFNNYTAFDDIPRERVVDSTRVHEGLPTDVTLTPEDFANHPELAEMFEVANTNNNFDLVLESNEHFERMQDLAVAHDYLITLLDFTRVSVLFPNTTFLVVRDFILSFF
jgi:hypothetical protein